MKVNKGNIEIGINEMVESMSTDEKKAIIKSIVAQDDVIKWVIDFICGDDEDGWWTSIDHRYREDLLKRVEKAQISNVSQYKWTLIDEAAKKLKEIYSNTQLYWALYNHPDKYNITVNRFLEGRDSWNEFQTKAADEKIQEVIDIVKKAVQRN